MKRRCEFLEKLPAFYLNEGGGEYVTNEQGKKILTDTQKLGSTLMRTMLKEVSDFCDPAIKKNWSTKPHQQVCVQFGMCTVQYVLIVNGEELGPYWLKCVLK